MGAAQPLILTSHDIDGGVAAAASVPTYLGRTAFYGALLTVLIFAIPYGTVEPRFKSAFAFVTAILGVIRLADKMLRGDLRVSEVRLMWPMIGVIVLAAIQIVPLPFGDAVSSLDGYETESFILVFGSLIVCGEILFTYTNSVDRLRMLVGVVFAVAFGSALFGIARAAVAGGEYDLFEPYFRGEQAFGQFINRNHFAMLVEMALGLLIGILLRAELSEKKRFAGWLFACTLIYSLIAANSRGGLVSLAGLAVFAVFMHVFTRPVRPSYRSGGEASFAGWLHGRFWRKLAAASGLAVVVFGSIVFIVAFVGGDAVVSRIEKIDSEIEAADNGRVNRNRIWRSTVELIKARPILGSGFGAYETAITEYDTSSGRFTLKQAHNDYLEILANGGLAALALFSIFGFLVFRRARENIAAVDPFRAACSLGAAVGIFGVLIHSIVDFGLHAVANALIFILLIVAATAVIKSSESPKAGRSTRAGM